MSVPSKVFWLRQSTAGALISIPVAVLAAAYLGEVLHLPEHGWKVFVGSVSLLVLPLFVVGTMFQRRQAQPLSDWLDHGASGDPRVDAQRFRALIRNPQDTVLLGTGFWLAGATVVVLASLLLTPEFGPFDVAATYAGCLSASIASGALIYCVARMGLADARAEAAKALPVELRAAEVRKFSLGAKLHIAFAAVGLLPLLLTAFLVQGVGEGSGVLTGQVFTVALLSGLFATVLAGALSRDLSGTANQLVASLERLAARDLTEGISVESDDEFGELGRACDRVAESLSHAVRRMSETAERVEDATHTLQNAGGSVTEASSRQARAAEDASDAVHQIARDAVAMAIHAASMDESVHESSSTIAESGAQQEELREMANRLFEEIDQAVPALAQIADSSADISARAQALTHSSDEAHQATQELAAAAGQIDQEAAQTGTLTESVVEASRRGRERVRSSDAGLESIRHAVTGSAQALEQLNERVGQIHEVVQLIEEVASETHLLSLNAAIIAAQAGDEGRGFAIVAGEVRGLAHRVTTRTQEISDLIQSVESSTGEAWNAMADTREAVNEGSELWRGAGVVLDEIAQAAQESGERVAEILRAIRTQGSATKHMDELMSGVSADVKAIAHAVHAANEGQLAVASVATSIRDVAGKVHGSAEEQSKAVLALRDGVLTVEEASRTIAEGLKNQDQSCKTAQSLAQQVNERAEEQGDAALQVADGVTNLAEATRALREEVSRFRWD